ncbi:hypothetical protein U1Q18_044973 [Sarracenia purpurea var. burkii]
MTCDIIEDFCETDLFSAHLDVMFSEGCQPLSWDKEKAYTRAAVELYYEVGSGACLSKNEILRSLLEGTTGSQLESFGDEGKHVNECLDHGTSAGRAPSKWVKVNEKRTLHDILKEPDLIIPGIPVFYVVSKSSGFYKDFKGGKWASPSLGDE